MNIRKISFWLTLGIIMVCQVASAASEHFSTRNVGVSPHYLTSVSDDKYSIMTAGSAWQNEWENGTVEDFVEVGISEELTTYLTAPYHIKLKFEATGFDLNQVAGAAQVFELELSYDNLAGSAITNKSVYEFQNFHHFEYELVGIEDAVSGANITTLPSNVYITGRIKVERFYKLDPSLIPANGVTHSTFASFNTTLNEWEINWDYIPGAESYDLEWTWVNNYTGNRVGEGALFQTNPTKIFLVSQGSLGADELCFDDFEFDRNATRVNTHKQQFSIPAMYESGFILYRLRARGWTGHPDKNNTPGLWSTDNGTVKQRVSDYDNVSIINGHEPRLNWQSQVIFTEDAKRKELVSYSDGSSRTRQTITKINSNFEDQVIVAESFYDYQGRGSIQTIPAPAGGNTMRYYPSFNQNVAGSTYNRNDFDLDDANSQDCEIPFAGGMSENSGSSKYFSNQNPLNQNWQDYVPDAKLYPFSQVEYEPDNTGRIRRQSGVGIDHRLGTSHETQMFYGKARQEELDRLFGLNVGFAKHYKKNMTVDPNGQVSVTYIDPQGRSIATALAGESPDNLLQLPNMPATLTPLTVDLLNKYSGEDELGDPIAAEQMPDTELDDNELGSTGNFALGIPDKLTVSVQHNVPRDNSDHEFTYQMCAKAFKDTCLVDSCYPFVYDLLIEVTDKCAADQLSDGTNSGIKVQQTLGIPTDGLRAVECDVSTKFIDNNLSAQLDLGTYTITKEIVVNEDAVNFFADRYVDDAGPCILTYDDFLAEQYEKIDTNGCEISCGLCLRQTIIGYGGDSIGIDEQTNQGDWNALFASLDPILVSNYQLTQAGWAALYEGCMAPCVPTNICETNHQLLLSDVSPGGQWGDVTFTTLFGIQASIYSSSPNVAVHAWKNPKDGQGNFKPFLDQYGNPSFVEFTITTGVATIDYNISAGVLYDDNMVQVTGSIDPTVLPDGTYFIEPQYMNVLVEFLANWEDSWAEALVAYHPEYCYYESCLQLLEENANSTDPGILACPQPVYNEGSSFDFDQAIMEASTWDDATQLMADGGIEATATSSQICFNDPYFAANGKPGLAYLVPHGLDTYIFGFGTPGTPYSITTNSTIFTRGYNRINIIQEMANYHGSGMNLWELAMYSVKCGTYYGTGTCNPGNFNNPADFTPAEQDQVWQMFRGLYISEKQKIQQRIMHLVAIRSGCYNGLIGTGASNYKGENDKRFLDAIDLLVSIDDTMPPLDNLLDIVTEGMFEETGVCPLAVDLKLFLNSLVVNDQFAGNPAVNLFGNPMFTPGLYAAVRGIDVVDIPGNPFVLQKLKRSFIDDDGDGTDDELLLTFTPASPNPYGSNPCNNLVIGSECLEDLPGPISWSTHGTQWNLVGIPELVFTEQIGTEYHFNMLVLAQIGSNPDNVIELVFSGHTCIPIGNCSEGCSERGLNPFNFGNILELYFNEGKDELSSNLLEDELAAQLDLGLAGSDYAISMEVSNRFCNKNGNLGLSLSTAPCERGDCQCCVYFRLATDPEPNQPIVTPTADNITYVYGFHTDPSLGPNEFYITAFLDGSNEPHLLIGTAECLNFYEMNDCCIPEPLQPMSCFKAFQDLAVNLPDGIPFPDFGGEDVSGNGTNVSPLVTTTTRGNGQGNNGNGQGNFTSFGNNGNNGNNGNGNNGNGNNGNGNNGNGNGNPDFELPTGLTEFCDQNLKYFVQPYLDYLNVMGVITVSDPNYLTLQQFAIYNSLGTAEVYTTMVQDAASLSVGVQSYIATISLQDFAQGDYRLCAPAYLEFLANGPTGGNIIPIDEFCEHYGTDDSDCSPFPAAAFPPLEFELGDPCKEWLINMAEFNAQTAYNQYIDLVTESFKQRYIESAIECLVENFNMSYMDGEFHRTLFYYDQGGNLTRTVPPAGQDVVFEQSYMSDPTLQTAIDDARLNSLDLGSSTPNMLPDHRYPTTYHYNSLSQLNRQVTPDGGTSVFMYDPLSRIVLSQNAKQRAFTIPTFSYTLYDDLGRVQEAGEIEQLSSFIGLTAQNKIAEATRIAKDAAFFNQPGNELYDWINGITEPGLKKYTVTKTYYDFPVLDNGNNIMTREEKAELRNRIAEINYTEELDLATETLEQDYDWACYYAYDLHGNVLSKVDEFKSLEHLGESLFRVDYEYDLISGNVNKVSVEKGEKGEFHHKYCYDADNRITNVFTSQDDKEWIQDAKYFYYSHGPLAREEIGDKKVQGADYAYTIQGWLKGVNSNKIDPNQDIGKDGVTGGLNAFVGRDAMGFTLDYYVGDYLSRQATTDFTNGVNALNGSGFKDLFNGNIGRMSTALTDLNSAPLPLIANHYDYDQLNRFKEMNSFTGTDYASATNTQQYNTKVSFDANGNIITLDRQGADGEDMDKLVYHYYKNDNTIALPGDLDVTNKLAYVDDNVAISHYPEDLRGQLIYNYKYDEIGQLVSDDKEEIAEIVWDVTNKVRHIHRSGNPITLTYFQGVNTITPPPTHPDDIEFKYDAMGNRRMKIVKPWIGGQVSTQEYWTYTYYVRDAQGNVLTTYERNMSTPAPAAYTEHFIPLEHHLYGNKRLGVLNHYSVDGSPAGNTINYLHDGTPLYNADGTINYNALDEQP